MSIKAILFVVSLVDQLDHKPIKFRKMKMYTSKMERALALQRRDQRKTKATVLTRTYERLHERKASSPARPTGPHKRWRRRRERWHCRRRSTRSRPNKTLGARAQAPAGCRRVQLPHSFHPLFVCHRVQSPEQGQVLTCLVGNRPRVVRKVILFLR